MVEYKEAKEWIDKIEDNPDWNRVDIEEPALSQLKELVDKATLKKPFYEGDGYDDKGNLVYDIWVCPNCNKRYEVDYEEYEHCPNCGQAIDWSDEE